ncbi:MAG: DUF4388 domain-containing protein [Opitutaceae bacterium]
MNAHDKPLAGWLWMRSGGRDFSLALDRVRRVTLRRQLRCAPAGAQAPLWWQGVTLDAGMPHPLLNLAALIGVPSCSSPVPDAVVVLALVWGKPVGLVCDRFRGIIPPSTPSWALSPQLFVESAAALPSARWWEGQPVLDLAPEGLFTPARRAQFDQSMTDSKENVDQLWELSEMEQKLSAAPSAQGYLDLAARYRKLGWEEEASRMQARAGEIRQEPTAAPRPAAGGLSGPCTPRVLLELLQVLRLTGKTGELLLDAPGRLAGSITFRAGAIVAARCGEQAEPRAALRELCTLRGGRYQFFPGAHSETAAPVAHESAAWMAELERLVLPAS